LGWKPPAREAAAEERWEERRLIRDLLKLPTEDLFLLIVTEGVKIQTDPLPSAVRS